MPAKNANSSDTPSETGLETGPETAANLPTLMSELWRLPGEMAQAMIGQLLPLVPANLPAAVPTAPSDPEGVDSGDSAHWAEVATRLQTMWLEFQSEQTRRFAQAPGTPMAQLQGAGQWFERVGAWMARLPLARPEVRLQLWEESAALWQHVLGQAAKGQLALLEAMTGPSASPEGAAAAKAPAEVGAEPPPLPRRDKRFAAAQWRELPFFAMLHQSYLLMAEQVVAAAEAIEGVEGIDPARKEQLRFATRVLVDALSPDHYPLTNPLVIERAVETRGESLIRGMEHLLSDLRRGKLTHTDDTAFRVGENIATTPGKVVHETALFQLIQYTPVTEKVLEVPLVVFPPWINRFYILDLNPKKSFVRWAVEQGITVCMVSWKSADASMAEVSWDDYIAAQIEAIDVVRARLKVPAVHAIGYCVAGTTLAATLAVLARRGEAEKVASATFFTAQVDFEKAGELKNFVDDQQIAAIAQLSPEGFLDGRYMAATFNLLRGNDLIWNYVLRNYLLGEEYQAFDLLHWNADTTNLPAKWHRAYLTDLYRDNRLVVPDSLSALGTPIDLTRIATPCYIQAGREDHIAPVESVWCLTRHLPHADWTFVVGGSGHIAGVVNPPGSGKYQHWTLDAAPEAMPATVEEFLERAQEHAGSWWPHWLGWLHGFGDRMVSAKGKRAPGGRGDRVIEDAPGRYVRST